VAITRLSERRRLDLSQLRAMGTMSHGVMTNTVPLK
jgi:hypothetical protein